MRKGGLSCRQHLIIVTRKRKRQFQRKNVIGMNIPSEIFLQVFETMLCFDKWLRKDTYWADHNAEVTKAIVPRLIAMLMHLSK